MDSGNIAGLSPLIGRQPFADSIYDGGGNVRASDGPVLGEQIVQQIGGDPANTQLFNILSLEPARSVQVHNYAHGGAQSGDEPSQSFLGFRIGIGLASQVRAMKQRSGFYRSQSDVDVLLSAGANDLLEALGDLTPFESVLTTPRRKDDRRLIRSLSRPISRNIRKTVDQITGLVDDVVVFASFPISATPKARRRAAKLDGVDEQPFLDLLDGISRDLIRRLGKAFQDNESIAVLDGQSLWNQLEDPKFLDDVHPTSSTSLELAELAVPVIQDKLESFGFV